MSTIPFPYSYKQALLSKSKNVTIRLGKEIGKYKEGKIYQATSYDGRDWGVKVKVKKIVSTKVSGLSALGIPKQSIRAILKRDRVGINTQVELISFDVI